MFAIFCVGLININISLYKRKYKYNSSTIHTEKITDLLLFYAARSENFETVKKRYGWVSNFLESFNNTRAASMQFLNDHEIFYNHSLNLILSLQLQLQHHQMHMLMLTMLINENLHLVPVVIIMKIIIINCVLVVVVVLIFICIENIYNISRMCVCVCVFLV